MFSNRISNPFLIDCFGWCQWFDSSCCIDGVDVFVLAGVNGLIQVDSFDGVDVFESISNRFRINFELILN